MSFNYRVVSSVAIAGAVALVVTSCGARGTDADGADPSNAPEVASSARVSGEPIALDPAAKKAVRIAHINAVDPQFPIADTSQFTSLVLGRVVEFRDGPVMEDYPGAKDSQPWVVVKIEPTAVLQGNEEVGVPIYVQLTTSDRQGLARAIPAGTLTLMAVRPLDPAGDRYLTDPWAGVPEGATRYIAGAPYAAFADGPTSTWFPILGTTYPQPIQALVPASLKSLLPSELQ